MRVGYLGKHFKSKVGARTTARHRKGRGNGPDDARTSTQRFLLEYNEGPAKELLAS